MHQDLVKDITKNNYKIAIIIDESTSVAKDCCLAVYITSVLNSSPVNIFLNMVELGGQDANSICNSLLDSLESNGLDNEYLAKNLIALTSDGASVIMGTIKGVATILKVSANCGVALPQSQIRTSGIRYNKRCSQYPTY